MKTQEIQNKIFNQEIPISELYKLQIEINEKITNMKRSAHMAETQLDQIEMNGEIKILYSLLETLQYQVSDLRNKEADQRDENGRLNHNFRMAARGALKKETYDKIMDIAHGSMRDVREQTKQLQNNRLE